jgi:hypothetical protein
MCDGRHRFLLGLPVQANIRVWLTFGLGGGNDRTSNYPIIRTDPGCDRHLHPGPERLRVLDAERRRSICRGGNHANDHRCLAGAAGDGLDEHLCRCGPVVCELPPRRLELRIFFSRAMLGHRARRWQCILCPEPLPGDGLRDVGWKLEYSQPAEALSAQLLKEIFPATVRPSRFRQRDF